jgi:hypothetical protein
MIAPDSVSTAFAWRFGGPLAGLPPALAWTLLTVFGLLGAAWIVVSYRRTLVVLAPTPRRALTALRLALWLGLLLALAGPTRVERTFSQPTVRPLALLLDQSASMTTPDNRRQTRADDALRRWRALAPAAAAAHGEPRTFAFADTPEPIPLASSAASSFAPPTFDQPTQQTRLFASLDQLLASAPPGGWGGIVALTDGLDTTTPDTATALEASARAALAAGTPFYLLPGRNRHSGAPLLALRDLVLPTSVPPRSTFALEVTLDTYQPAARTVPARLRVGSTWREPEALALEAGRRLRTYRVELAAQAPGLIPLELQVGEGPETTTLRAEVRVAAPVATRILYYQGALDWGYRFLADILRREPAFTLTPVFNLAPPGAARRPAGSSARTFPAQPGPTTLPENAAGYANYDVVILANARADQFSPAQQEALSGWVRGGGVLLFLAPDDDATRGYAGTELEKMLPVVFAPPGAAPHDPTLADFREQMRRSGGSDGALERDFAEHSARHTRLTPLSSFAWEPRAATVLGPEVTAVTPRFAHHARVHRAKPGADVLARHPDTRAPAAEENAILLALQRYGRGQSAVLASDALWRWKLHQPSRERGVELFWQNLLAWLGREAQHGPRFVHAPLHAEVRRELLLRVAGAGPGLSVTVAPATAPGAPGADAAAAAAPTALLPVGEEEGARLYRWLPPAEGTWVLSARGVDADAPPARHWLTIARPPTGEASGLPPDESLLRALAERSGGAVLADAPPPAWRSAAEAAPALLRESAEPLWHQAWLFATLLALYAAELILRRRQRLL